jgi:hypothetical protein
MQNVKFDLSVIVISQLFPQEELHDGLVAGGTKAGIEVLPISSKGFVNLLANQLDESFLADRISRYLVRAVLEVSPACALLPFFDLRVL